MFLCVRAAPLGPWGVAGCVSGASLVYGDFCAPSATHAGLVAKRHMAQSQQPTVNVYVPALQRIPASSSAWAVWAAKNFKISLTTPLHKLFVSYSTRQDIPLALLSWSTFDGNEVRGDQTPADIGFEAGSDVILVAALTRASLRDIYRSPLPGGLLPELLQGLLEFLPLKDVHEIIPATKRLRWLEIEEIKGELETLKAKLDEQCKLPKAKKIQFEKAAVA